MTEDMVVCFMPFGAEWRWSFENLVDSNVHWAYFSDKPRYSWQKYFQRPNLVTPLAAFSSVWCAVRHKARLLITFDARLAFWCGFICRVLGIKLDHLVFSFNFPDLPEGAKQKLFRFAFQQLAHVRVHSHLEQDLYSRYFGIPKDRIEVRLISMNVPDVSPDPPVLESPYVSSVGGNARDYQTLLAASRLLPEIPMIWVVRPENIAGLELPPNVHVLFNIPYPKAMNVVKHSCLTIVPLKDSEVPCGHITLVSAMLLEKAIVATDSAGIKDYVRDGWSGLLCHPGDADDLAQKIHSLWEDRDEARRMGENGFHFAEKYCTEELARQEMFEFFKDRGLAANEYPRSDKRVEATSIPDV